MKLKKFIASIPAHTLLVIKKHSLRDGKLFGREMTIEKLMDISWNDLKKTIPSFFSDQKYEEAIAKVFRLPILIVLLLPKKSRLKLVLWINDQYEKINSLENQYLSSPPDGDMIQAGIKDLDVLGDFVMIDNLSGGDPLKYSSIENLPYSVIFNKQLKNTIENRVQKKLIEIQKEKAKK